MKTITRSALLALIPLLSFLIPAHEASAQQLKVGSVDMSKVFSEYYKTQKAEAELKDRASAVEKELRDQESNLKTLSEEVKKLKEDAENPAFNTDKKAEKRRTMETKITEGRVKLQQLNDMVKSRKQELDVERNRMRDTLVKEIVAFIKQKAQKEGYTMIVDTTGLTLSGVSPFIFLQDSLDITPDVIKSLNAQAPAAGKK